MKAYWFLNIFRLRVALWTSGCLLVLFSLNGTPALAGSPASQTDSGDDVWSAPLNLSRSGAATAFQPVTDAQGQLHLIWQDAIDGFFYSHGSGDSWSEPAAVELPFGTREFFPDLEPEEPTPLFHPLLVAGSQGQIHAFWTDNAGSMWHSQVAAAQFDDFESWTPRQLLAEGVLAVDAVSGSANTIQLAYLRFAHTGELPAGVYYQRLSADAVPSLPALLYASDYLRTLTRDAANLDIVTSENGRIYVAWDNPALDKVFLTRSSDGGSSWDPAIEVDGRLATDSPEAAGPAQIMLSATGDDVLALWEAAHEGFDCALHYRWSSDGGDTWQPHQRLDAVEGCPEASVLLPSKEEFALLMTTVTGVTSFAGWNGEQWSRAAVEESLAAFPNPATFKQIDFGCHRPIYGADSLYIFGCDAGGGQDIWMRARPLGSIAGWFPEPPVWSKAHPVAASDVGIDFPLLAGDGAGRLHAFWGQPGGVIINHAVWDSARWSQPRAVLTSTAIVGEPAVTVHNGDRLLVAWADLESGQIHLIGAAADQSLLASDWSTSIDLPQRGAAWPAMSAAQSGRIYLAYAVPVNEARGIYLISSDNLGESWTDTVTVFDGAAARWTMVGRPRLALSQNGRLYMLWTQQTMPGGRGAIALFFAQSGDEGQSWTEPVEVSGAPVAWSDVVVTAEQTVHLLWQEVSGSSTQLRHQRSTDDGLTWSLPDTIANVEGTAGTVATARGAGGSLHLVHSSLAGMQHWLWSEDSWLRAEDIESDSTLAVGGMSAAVISGSELAVIFAERAPGAAQPALQETLWFASRPLDGVPTIGGAPQTAATVAPAAPPVTTANPSPSAPPSTPATVAALSQIDPPMHSTRSTALVSGLLPAGFIVLIGFILGFRLVRNGRR